MLSVAIKYLYFILFVCSCSLFAQSKLTQEIEVLLIESKEKEVTNEVLLQQLLTLLAKQDKTSTTAEMGNLYATIGKQYYKNANNAKAIVYLKKAIQIQKKYKKEALEVLNKTRNNLAWIYSYEGLDKERYQVLQEIINDGGIDKYTFNAGIDSAVIEANKGDFYAGLSRLNVLLTKRNEIDQEIQLRAAIIGIYGKMYESVFTPRKQSDLQIIKKHQQIIEKKIDATNLDRATLYTAYNNLAIVYDAFGDIETALQLYQKVKVYYTLQEETSKRLTVLNNIGFLYAKQGKYIQATNCYKEVIALSDDVAQIATAYDNMGYFLNSATAQKKIPYFQKAIQILLENKENTFTIPSLETIRNSGYQQDVFIYLVDLAYHYVEAYKETKAKKYLLQAKEVLYRIDELVSLMRYESNTEQSKLFWIEKGVNTYMLAVEVCYFLNLPNEAFYFMEKNKALLLQENIKTFQAKLAFEVPKQLREREYKLHYEVLALEKQFQQNSNAVQIKQNYAAKNKEFNIFMDSMQQKYPKYVQLKKGIETISLDKVITTNVSTKSCFITYILNEKEGYGIFCSEKEKIFFKIANVPTFQNNLIVLKNYMKQPILNKNEIIHFKEIGYTVFNSLFPFKEAISKVTNKRIIIVPDDTLLNLPFEALPIINTVSLSESYLVNKTAISYLQSFSVFEKIKQKRNQPKEKLLAMAPYQFDDEKLQELVRSQEAMQDLDDYQSATILIGKEATKESFYKYSSNYEIIHLNTHAGVDKLTETPWISFQKDKVTLDELYGIDSQAELVILDACKTNDGMFASGEGIISLSRGFFYNGSKSVLASLWNVNEKAGNEIIKTFYSELEQGKSKSRALQLAKINYLKEHQFSEVLPYYWASFTITGSTDSIIISKSNSFLYTALLLIGIIAILSFLWYKRKTIF
ncbi:CHAT domain-containing protein [Flavobacterium sp. HNIBRBA15423]|uniref:CHAT domain-containing protein n=1 Tax=Flavobacterium sp. HNIBRBA15423 TaxID=3458683 RepID=UPI004044537C